jgi:hypothetical protein
MGVSIKYNAIPINSSLYQRIQTEKPLCHLVNNLTIYYGGLFSFFDNDPYDETQDILDGLIEAHLDVFGSKAQADLVISDFRAEIDNMRQKHPGIENRTALIEKSFDDIKHCLVQEFFQRQLQNSDELVQKMLIGDQGLAPNLLKREDYPINVISKNLVREGAKILELIEPEQLQLNVPYWAEWGLEHLKAWRNLYLMANNYNEIILVSWG